MIQTLATPSTKLKARPSLPPAPPLDQRQFSVRSVHADGHGRVEALVPSDSRYHCKDPNAPALVLVPGLGMDGLGFIRQLPLGVFADIHLFQTPNEPAPGEKGLGHFARHVEAYITASGLDQRPGGVILGGCSMGGAVSICAAVRKRVNLRGLVLLGTFGHCRHLQFWQRLLAPISYAIPLRLGQKLLGRIVACRIAGKRMEPEEATWLVSNRLERTQGYFGRAVMGLTRQNQLASARNLSVPTLILHGARDSVLPYAAGQELAEHIPSSRLVTLDHSGHALFFTDHEIVNNAIAEFITELK